MTGTGGKDSRLQSLGWARMLVAFGAVSAVSACSGYDEEAFTSVEQDARLAPAPGTIVASRVRADSVIAREELPHGRWRYEGKIPLAPAGAENEPVREPVPLDEPESSREAAIEPANERMAILSPNGEVHSVEFTAEELELVTAVLERRGLAEASPGDGAADMVPKSWVNGVDNRVRYGLSNTTAAENNTIGLLSNGCTATFVGGGSSRYFIITASHCLFDNVGNALFPTFWPRHDSCRTSTGATMSGCQQTPFGAWWQNGGRIHYQGWLDSCRVNTSSSYCTARDISVAEVSRPAGVNYPGANGFAVESTSSSPALRHRGYPGCYQPAPVDVRAPDAPGGSISPPQVCTVGTAYGRSSGSWGDSFEGGLGMKFSFSTSGGHSGGPYWLGSNGRVVAVHSSASATNCKPVGTTNCARPSRGPRITSTFYGWMLDFMGL